MIRRMIIGGVIGAVAAIGCAIALGAGMMSDPRLDPIALLPYAEGCDGCAPIVLQIAWSLQNEPNAWSSDGFYLCRSGNSACMWIANQAYGLEIGSSRWSTMQLDDDRARVYLYAAFQCWLLDQRRWR